jgi:hypothetical protein
MNTWYVGTGKLGSEETKFLRRTVSNRRGMLVTSYILEEDSEDATHFQSYEQAWVAANDACYHLPDSFEVHCSPE